MKELQELGWKIWKLEGREQYFRKNQLYKHLPWITGCPEITPQPWRPYIARSLLSKQPVIKLKVMPRYAHIRKIVNYPFRKWGAPMISIVGTYGSGKSILMNLLIAFYLARGVRILQFNDRRMECRHLAAHGYYDKKGNFQPFTIDIWIPKGYEFRNANPIWDYYKNVHVRYWENYDQIIDSMQHYKLTVVYEECFDEEGKLKLWIDLMEALGENMNPNVVNMFTHHELSSLIPETPTKEIYKTVRQASNIAMNLRKDRIGLLTTFHISSEVFFRISQKFGFVIIKRPVNRPTMTDVEKDALGYSVEECNISRGGYWMKHEIGYYPELPDLFRCVPQRKKLNYPELNILEDEIVIKDEYEQLDKIDYQILTLRATGKSWRSVAACIGLSLQPTYERGKKLGIVG